MDVVSQWACMKNETAKTTKRKKESNTYSAHAIKVNKSDFLLTV